MNPVNNAAANALGINASTSVSISTVSSPRLTTDTSPTINVDAVVRGVVKELEKEVKDDDPLTLHYLNLIPTQLTEPPDLSQHTNLEKDNSNQEKETKAENNG